ncbi:hypothetical protein C8A00DRAFT_35494 [Chaetomidium leptoderma]|uniref:F-box domain-containing protein n=1 Tax=Chaetomidium leptoderma TaxID=669021 RepID=A0AAN6ZVP0_9PEZI|nr:hypothetical protein C8A00DRAFT_35494 [Chaetomidium leptoderma]
MSDTTMVAMESMDPQTGSMLTQIPLEILVRITRSISTKDLGNVRLSCKALEQGLFHFFSHEFFRKKQFMATTDSLQALVDISKHPTLSPFLKHVIISADRPAVVTQWGPQIDQKARDRLEVAIADHMHLMATGGLRDMLVEAFAHLANLETVDIRNFNSPSRNREGLGTQWRSYGAIALEASTSSTVEARTHSDQDQYTAQLFCAVTTALAVAEARPKSIEVLLRTQRGRFAVDLGDTAFYIPPRMEPSMSSMLANLKTLHLTLGFLRWKTARPFILGKFLSLATGLTWLRLNFGVPASAMLNVEEVFSLLAPKDFQNANALPATHPINLPHLERLDLGDAETEAAALLRLVAKFAPTLTSLYLRRVCIVDPENHNRTTKINPWERYLSAMCRLPGLNLRVLDFSSITTASNGWRGPVSFKVGERADATPRYSPNWKCSTSFVTFDKVIGQAIAAMHVDWPQPLDPNGSDDESSGEEEEYVEEEDDEEEDDGEGEE